MPITINGDGSITGLSVGGLGSGVVNDTTLASNAVTNAKIANSAVTLAKTTGVSGLVPLNTVTVSSNTSAVTFTETITGAFSTYKTYMIVMDGVRSVSDNEDFEMRIRYGSNGTSLYSNSDYYSGTVGVSADEHFGVLNRFRLNYNNVGNFEASGYVKEDWNCTIYLHGFENNRRLRYHGHNAYMSSDGALRGQYIHGAITDSREVTGLELQYTNQNNIATGRFSLFGVNG